MKSNNYAETWAIVLGVACIFLETYSLIAIDKALVTHGLGLEILPLFLLAFQCVASGFAVSAGVLSLFSFFGRLIRCLKNNKTFRHTYKFKN